MKFDQQLQREVDIYRIRLPGPLKLGEGKPETQNHVITFTRGDAFQTIDMNQDNHFEEALKMRNLLESFKNHYGVGKPTILVGLLKSLLEMVDNVSSNIDLVYGGGRIRLMGVVSQAVQGSGRHVIGNKEETSRRKPVKGMEEKK